MKTVQVGKQKRTIESENLYFSQYDPKFYRLLWKAELYRQVWKGLHREETPNLLFSKM